MNYYTFISSIFIAISLIANPLHLEGASRRLAVLTDQVKLASRLLLRHEPAVTQTEAHLSDPQLKRAARATFVPKGIPCTYMDTLFLPVLAREQSHALTHYPAYHGFNNKFLIIQDLIALIKQHHGEPVRPDFVYLRHKSCPHKTVQAFLKQFSLSELSTAFDHRQGVRDYLLPINFAITGNVLNLGESSAYYCAQNISIFEDHEEVIKKILEEYGFNPAYSKKFAALSSLLTCSEGSLLQILIPKKEIDKVVYLCEPYGAPATPLYYKNGAVIAPQDLERQGGSIKTIYGRCSGVLKARSSHPHKISTKALDCLQGRILLNQYMINPATPGLKMFVVNTIPAPLKAEYTKQLKALFAQMIKATMHSAL